MLVNRISMWFQTRRKLLRLEKQIQRQSELLAQVTRQLAGLNHPAGPDLGAIIGSMLETQGKQFTSAGDFLRTINEIAIDRAQHALGRRGGQARSRTAKRDRRGRLLPSAARSDCPLCIDPMTANFSMAEWGAHQNHRGRVRNVTPRDEGEMTETDVTEHRPAEQQPVYPLPVIDLSAQHAAGGAGGGTPEGDVDHGDHIHKADGTIVTKAPVSERN